MDKSYGCEYVGVILISNHGDEYGRRIGMVLLLSKHVMVGIKKGNKGCTYGHQ